MDQESLAPELNLPYTYLAKWIIIHFLLLIGVYILYGLFNHQPLIPEAQKLLRDDAIHYQEIKNHGYTFFEDKQSNVAFFPGFPYLWKLTGLGIYGICVLNFLLFAGSFWLLAKNFQPGIREMMIYLSLPPLLFMYVPFSEALFYFPSALLLIGLLKRQSALIIIALFLASLCRSAANVFLPAIIITEILAHDNPSRLKNIVTYSLASVAGVFLVAWFQYTQTGQWMGFMTTQKYWEVKLRWPALPFQTWGNMQFLDGACLIAGIIAGGIVLYAILKFIRDKIGIDNKAYLFSLLYIAGLTFFTIAFKGGNLFSLNRYLVPTAFFFVAFFYTLRSRQFSSKQASLGTIAIFIFWLLFHSYTHIKVLLGYLIFTVYLSLYFVINHTNNRNRQISFYLLYITNLVFQVNLFYKFLADDWIG